MSARARSRVPMVLWAHRLVQMLLDTPLSALVDDEKQRVVKHLEEFLQMAVKAAGGAGAAATGAGGAAASSAATATTSPGQQSKVGRAHVAFCGADRRGARRRRS